MVFVRRLFHTLTTLGFAAAVAPLALISSPSVPLATACLTLASALYACSFGGFHAYLQVSCCCASMVMTCNTGCAAVKLHGDCEAQDHLWKCIDLRCVPAATLSQCLAL